VIECVPNVAEGRDRPRLDALTTSCGKSLLDLHVDADHHRSVLTLAGPGKDEAPLAARALALAVGEHLDLTGHSGVHPRLGVLDVVPFVALDGSTGTAAIEHARDFAAWVASALAVPVFLYADADPDHRSLPDARRDAFTRRAPDAGPPSPHPQLGAVAVGARPVLVAVNCELDRGDITIARSIAHTIRERDGGLPGVRALGFMLASGGTAQVSMNLIALEQTGLQQACEAVRDLARRAAVDISRVELVGLVPAAELARCDQGFLEWSAISPDQTIEARLARA
jgi:glutamate formiminotransferase / 5-formyltetrahydrofolate cyclo-ligase